MSDGGSFSAPPEQCVAPPEDSSSGGRPFSAYLVSEMMPLPSDVAEAWLRKLARDTRFEHAVRNRRFRHPETGNQVLFVSLPPEEQARIRAMFDRQTVQEGQGQEQEVQEQEGDQEPPKKEGPWTKRVVEKAKEAVDATTRAGKNLVRFVRDPEYRSEVKDAFVAKKDDFKKKASVEARESKEMLNTFGRVLAGKEVPSEEREQAVEQLKDIGKMAVLTSVTVAPLGPLDDIILLALTAGVKLAFPEFSWVPSAWRTPIEAAEGRDLADRIVDRLYEGVLRALEDPSEEDLLRALEQMGRSRA